MMGVGVCIFFFIMKSFICHKTRKNKVKLFMMMPTELAISFLCYTAFSCKICADWDPDAGEGI